MVTKTYMIPSNLCDCSDSSDSCDSSDSSDKIKKKTQIVMKLKNSNCDKTQ